MLAVYKKVSAKVLAWPLGVAGHFRQMVLAGVTDDIVNLTHLHHRPSNWQTEGQPRPATRLLCIWRSAPVMSSDRLQKHTSVLCEGKRRNDKTTDKSTQQEVVSEALANKHLVTPCVSVSFSQTHADCSYIAQTTGAEYRILLDELNETD